jgi:hypothetical protein
MKRQSPAGTSQKRPRGTSQKACKVLKTQFPTDVSQERGLLPRPTFYYLPLPMWSQPSRQRNARYQIWSSPVCPLERLAPVPPWAFPGYLRAHFGLGRTPAGAFLMKCLKLIVPSPLIPIEAVSTRNEFPAATAVVAVRILVPEPELEVKNSFLGRMCAPECRRGKPPPPTHPPAPTATAPAPAPAPEGVLVLLSEPHRKKNGAYLPLDLVPLRWHLRTERAGRGPQLATSSELLRAALRPTEHWVSNADLCWSWGRFIYARALAWSCCLLRVCGRWPCCSKKCLHQRDRLWKVRTS